MCNKQLTEEHRLRIENLRLRAQLETLQKRQHENSWKGEVDRASGAFTQDEIANATAWR
jgi:regulator of replication initiation timing